MNDSMSILFATTILGISGLCLYMYKSNNSDDEKVASETDYDDEGLFGSNFWGLSNDKEKNDDETTQTNDSVDEDEDDEDEEDEAYIKKMVKLSKKEKATTKKRQTLKNKKGSRRTY